MRGQKEAFTRPDFGHFEPSPSILARPQSKSLAADGFKAVRDDVPGLLESVCGVEEAGFIGLFGLAQRGFEELRQVLHLQVVVDNRSVDADLCPVRVGVSRVNAQELLRVAFEEVFVERGTILTEHVVFEAVDVVLP